jgi:hypothetical protein
MKNLGYLLISLAFLVGAYFTVVQTEGVPFSSYLPAFIVGVVGVAMVRRAIHREAHAEGTIAANLSEIGVSLEKVVSKARALEREKDEIDVYELRHRIDREFPTDLDTFVQARESISHRFGLQVYAEVMNAFSAGERNLNRVWSASTDGYIDEAHTYIGKARAEFENALAAFRAVHQTD